MAVNGAHGRNDKPISDRPHAYVAGRRVEDGAYQKRIRFLRRSQFRRPVTLPDQWPATTKRSVPGGTR